MKAESWKIRFSGKCNVMREKNSWLFKIARLLVCFDHVARFIANANHGVVRPAEKLCDNEVELQ
jgi:hypothetical protein